MKTKDEIDEDLTDMDLNEFCSDGFLQEVNRLFFNRLGLVFLMETDPDDTTKGKFAIKDGRKTYTGFLLADLDKEKTDYIENLRLERLKGRVASEKTDKDGKQIK